MLATQAVKLTTIGDDTYYILDGKVWRISGGTVFRSDDTVESAALQQMCQTI
jgi:hypothetical protein